jgi:hypothetical protein
MAHRQVQPPEEPKWVQPSSDEHARSRHTNAPVWVLLAVGLIFFCLVAVGVRIKQERAHSDTTATVIEFPVESFRLKKEGVHSDTVATTDHGTGKTTRAGSQVDPNPAWIVEGFGINMEDANKSAWEKANALVVEYLDNQTPALQWRPSSSDFIKKNFKIQPIKINDNDTNPTIPDFGKMVKVSFRVEMTAESRKAIWEQEHHYRTENRQLFLAKILAGLIAVFAAFAGYVRLDEMSKGYYTVWLRCAAAGVIGAAGAGVWLLIKHR